jgi:hypothetical protein
VEFGIGERLGVAGLIMALIGIAVPILWPDKKIIGWICLTAALNLLAWWLWIESRSQIPDFYQRSPLKSTLAVFLIGGVLAASAWLLIMQGKSVAATPTAPDNHKTTTERMAPKLIATAISEIVARLFMRGLMPLPPATKAEFSPVFQEFFYDWILTLTPNGPTGDILIVLKESREHDDSIKVMPDIAVIHGPTGKWMSGFREEARRNPDYYETTIRFPEGLEKDRPARILPRRPVKIGRKTSLTMQDFSRDFDVSAGKAEVVKNYYQEAEQFELVTLQLKTLLDWKYSGTRSAPVPVRTDPNTPLPPLGRGEIETTLEVRCDNGAIGKKILVQQLEARKKDF